MPSRGSTSLSLALFLLLPVCLRAASFDCNTAQSFLFGSHEVGPYSSGMSEAKITWLELWLLLSPTLQPATLPPALPQKD